MIISSLSAALRRHIPLAGLIVIVGAIWALTAVVADAELDETVTEMLILLVVVVAIHIFVGNSGVISFGHIGFMAIGAYGEAWQTCCQTLKPMIMPGLPDFLLYHSVPFLPAIIASGLLAAVVAFVSGAVIMRLTGTTLSIATFAFLAIVEIVYSNWTRVTAGTSSIIGIPMVVGVGTSTCWALAAIMAAYFFQNSSVGLSLRASRDDEVAARASGVRIYRVRLIGYALSAFFAGVGGALYGHFLGILSPGIFYLSLTFTTLAMLVVGGIGSLAGAVLGTISISALTEILRQLEAGISLGQFTLTLPGGSQEIILGIAMLLILILRPKGMTNGKEIRWPVALRS